MADENDAKLKETVEKTLKQILNRIRCFTTIKINVLVLFGIAFLFLGWVYTHLEGSNVDAKEAFTLMKELMLVLITGVVAVAKDLVD